MIKDVEILLVEDSMYDAELTIRALKRNNLANNLAHLKDGADALNFIFSREEYSDRKNYTKPKIIFLDLNMHKIGGLEVLQQLKSNADTKSIPVVILTSSKEDPDVKRCYELGANSYVVKPVDFDNFQKAIAELGFYWMVVNQPAI